MNQLPSEILKEIFILLDQNDKVECMSVCRYWKQAIEQFVLYHTVYIFSADSLKAVTKMIQSTNKGNKVEQLVLSLYTIDMGYNEDDEDEDEDEDEDFQLNQLLLQLPNLQRLFCTGPWNQIMLRDKVTYPWQKSIKYIHEFSSGSITNQLLQQGVCLNLTSLIITDYENNIIPLLKNAPGLKSLTLGSGELKFTDLETIHKHTPHLESITLRGITLDDNTKIESMTITPSLSVTECIFEYIVARQLNARDELVNYISKKYPNVSKVIYKTHPHHEFDDFIFSSQDILSNFLRSTSSRLKYLHINGKAFCNQNPFKILDLHHCQLQTLKLELMHLFTKEDTIHSQQFQQIEKLSLLDAEFIKRFKYLNAFIALKKLKITGYEYEGSPQIVKLDDILHKTPPTLKSLSVHRVYFRSGLDYSRIYPSVENLSLDLCLITPEYDIARFFPNLTRLKIRNCEIKHRSLDLSTLDLFSFRFILNHDDVNVGGHMYDIQYIDYREYIDDYYDYFETDGFDDYSGIENSVLVITKNERRRYIKRKQTNPKEIRFFRMYNVFYPQVISWPERESDPAPRFTFRFNSLKNMIFE